MKLFSLEKVAAPAALIDFPCQGWVKLTDLETGDTGIGAVLHHTGFIRIPLDATKSAYGNELTAADCAETIAAAKALFAEGQ